MQSIPCSLFVNNGWNRNNWKEKRKKIFVVVREEMTVNAQFHFHRNNKMKRITATFAIGTTGKVTDLFIIPSIHRIDISLFNFIPPSDMIITGNETAFSTKKKVLCFAC